MTSGTGTSFGDTHAGRVRGAVDDENGEEELGGARQGSSKIRNGSAELVPPGEYGSILSNVSRNEASPLSCLMVSAMAEVRQSISSKSYLGSGRYSE